VIQRVTLSSKEAAEYLGISYWLLLEMVKRGKINPIRCGGRYLFRQSGLDNWMETQEASIQPEKKPNNNLTISYKER
jgi:DNA binding domain, excisionase family